MCAFIVKKTDGTQPPKEPQAPVAPQAAKKPTPAEAHPEPVGAVVEVATDLAAQPLSWDTLNLSLDVVELVKKEGLPTPTQVQAESIPKVLDGQDIIVSAQTGTGKTAAFVLPIIERVRGRNGTYALILCPMREIALQTQKVFEQFGRPFGVDAVSLIGGTDLKNDELLLRNYPQVIIATPGRMCDHIERGTIWLEYLEVLVLDEADRMLDMGFSTQLNRILEQTSKDRQTLLFSATVSTEVERLAGKILYQPHRVQIGKQSRSAVTVEQRFVFLSDRDKFIELEHLLYEEQGTIFVFTRSKDSAAKLWRDLRNRGFHQATQLHSNLEQNVREEALADFKSGKYRVLIATDVVGRGIHVDDVAHVINYDLPREAEDYVHRIGRTGRAEKTGIATSLVTPRDIPVLRQIERLTGKRIAVPNHMLQPEPSRGSGGGHGRPKPPARGRR